MFMKVCTFILLSQRGSLLYFSIFFIDKSVKAIGGTMVKKIMSSLSTRTPQGGGEASYGIKIFHSVH